MIDLVEVEKERLLDEVSPLCVVFCFLSLTERSVGTVLGM